MLKQILSEGAVKVREPQTPEQKRAFIDLVSWASSKMAVPDVEVKDAIEQAKEDDYREAMQLLTTFYAMKGMKVQRN